MGPGFAPVIEPASMPLMSLVSTWLDQTEPHRQIVEDNVSKFLATDTACFMAEPELRVLRRRQEEHFSKLHSWLASEFGIDLTTTDALMKIKHPEESVRRMQAIIETLDSAALTALQCATMESKSLVLALSVVLRQTTPEAAMEAARLEEEFQMEQWGLVEGGHDLDRVATKVSLTSSAVFMNLLDGDDGNEKRIEALRAAVAEVRVIFLEGGRPPV
eukprot:FR743461.1.p1 GENE.FR743461.1~~FR743461.1.p1  ORF type:complete len:254 (+),score=37.19 FR743461.1:113-763(+)